MPVFYSPNPTPAVALSEAALSEADRAYLLSWLTAAEAAGDAETAEVARLALGGYAPPSGYAALALATALPAAVGLVLGEAQGYYVYGAPVSRRVAEDALEAGLHDYVHAVPPPGAHGAALALARTWETPAPATPPAPAAPLVPALVGRRAVEAALRGEAGRLIYLRFDTLTEGTVTPAMAMDLLGSDAGDVYFLPADAAPGPYPPPAAPSAARGGV